MALNFLEAAEAATGDAVVMNMLTRDIGLDPGTAAGFVMVMREERARIDPHDDDTASAELGALMLDARYWDVSPTARHVGMVIASHANKWGRAWPSIETIAVETGRHPRTVIRAVQELAKAEHVRVVERTGSVERIRVRQLSPTLPTPVGS